MINGCQNTTEKLIVENKTLIEPAKKDKTLLNNKNFLKNKIFLRSEIIFRHICVIFMSLAS